MAEKPKDWTDAIALLNSHTHERDLEKIDAARHVVLAAMVSRWRHVLASRQIGAWENGNHMPSRADDPALVQTAADGSASGVMAPSADGWPWNRPATTKDPYALVKLCAKAIEEKQRAQDRAESEAARAGDAVRDLRVILKFMRAQLDEELNRIEGAS